MHTECCELDPSASTLSLPIRSNALGTAFHFARFKMAKGLNDISGQSTFLNEPYQISDLCERVHI